METIRQKPIGKQWNVATGLALFTVIYNIGEGIVSLYFGAHDQALTLAGFGVDSFIEVVSGLGILAMIARLRRVDGKVRGSAEQLALRLTGVCFYGLAVGLVLGAMFSLLEH